MCTSLALHTPDFFFGRNLDLEADFGQQVIFTPRRHPFAFRKTESADPHLSMIGMGTIAGNYPLYADAVNEKGLAMAGLNFPDNAWYDPQAQDEKTNLAPFELIPFLLSRCESVDDARKLLRRIRLVALPFGSGYPLTPLHWHMADKYQSITLESTRSGMKIYDNPVGVLTNNPPFDFHLTNLRHYLNLTADYPENRFSTHLPLLPYGRGMGAIGLPGDASPISRFIRASFFRCNSVCPPETEKSVAQFFHLLAGVEMPRGSVKTEQGRLEYTRYSCCMHKGVYYYRTYENSHVTAVDMHREDPDGNELIAWPLRDQPQFFLEN